MSDLNDVVDELLKIAKTLHNKASAERTIDEELGDLLASDKTDHHQNFIDAFLRSAAFEKNADDEEEFHSGPVRSGDEDKEEFLEWVAEGRKHGVSEAALMSLAREHLDAREEEMSRSSSLRKLVASDDEEAMFSGEERSGLRSEIQEWMEEGRELGIPEEALKSMAHDFLNSLEERLSKGASFDGFLRKNGSLIVFAGENEKEVKIPSADVLGSLKHCIESDSKEELERFVMNTVRAYPDFDWTRVILVMLRKAEDKPGFLDDKKQMDNHDYMRKVILPEVRKLYRYDFATGRQVYKGGPKPKAQEPIAIPSWDRPEERWDNFLNPDSKGKGFGKRD